MKKFVSLVFGLFALCIGAVFAMDNVSWSASTLDKSAEATYTFEFTTTADVTDPFIYIHFPIGFNISPGFIFYGYNDPSSIDISVDSGVGFYPYDGTYYGNPLRFVFALYPSAPTPILSGSTVRVSISDIINPPTAGSYSWSDLLYYGEYNTYDPQDYSGSLTDIVIESPVTLISTCQEFMDIINDLGGSYRFTQDIDCTAEGNLARFGYSSVFTGILDGSGFMLEINLSAGGNLGLFTRTNGATIENLTLSGTIQRNASGGGNSVASLIVEAINTTVDNVHFVGDIVVNDAGAYVGGLVGIGDDIIIRNSSFSGTITSYGSIAGLLAAPSYESIWSILIENSSVVGTLHGCTQTPTNCAIGGLFYADRLLQGDLVISGSSTLGVTFIGGNYTGGLAADVATVQWPLLNATTRRAYLTTNILNNNNQYNGLAFGRPLEPGSGEGGGGNGYGYGSGDEGGSSSGGGGGSISLDSCPNGDSSGSYYDGKCDGTNLQTKQNPVKLPKLNINQVEKKKPVEFCKYNDTKGISAAFTDVVGTPYASAVGVLVSHCLVQGYNNNGQEFGINDPLKRGELYKVFTRMALLDFDLNTPGLGWSHGYKVAGESIGLWNLLNMTKDQSAPITQQELLQVTMNYLKYMGVLDEAPEFVFGSKEVTRGEFARFINIVLGLVSTR